MKFKELPEKIRKILKKPIFWIFLLIVITSLVFIPALSIKFWWVDDGWDVLTSRQILDSIFHLNFGGLNIIFNESGGRLRVMYWLYQAFEYLIGGNNPTLHFLLHYFVILLSAVLIFQIVYRLTKSNLSSFFSSMFYILIPINTENLFRLGPQEPLLGLFLITSIFFLLKNKVYVSILFLLFTILTKENGFVLWVPVFFIYLTKIILFRKRDRILEKYSFWGFIFSIPIALNMLLRHGGYSSFYSFEINKMIGNFKSYMLLVNEAFSPLLILFVVTFIIRIFIFFRDKKFKKNRIDLLYEAMFLLLFLAFIVVQVPWGFVLNRYTMPATIGLVIFMGIEIAGIKDLVQIKWAKFLPWLYIIFALYIASFFWINSLHIFLAGELSAHQTTFIQSLYKNLSEETPTNGTVLLNFKEGDSTKELVVETEMHLDLFYNRSDIKVAYLDLDNLPNSSYVIVGTPQVPEGYSQKQIEKKLKTYRKDESLALNDSYLVFTTPMNLFKQITKKIYQFVSRKTPITAEGIYTYYLSQDYWYKYFRANN